MDLCAPLAVSLYDEVLEEELLGQKINFFKFLEKLLNFVFQNIEFSSHGTAVYERTCSPYLPEMWYQRFYISLEPSHGWTTFKEYFFTSSNQIISSVPSSPAIANPGGQSLVCSPRG